MNVSPQIRIHLLQLDLIWESPVENQEVISLQLKELYRQTDLVVLPEMFTTGFSMNPQGIASDAAIIDYLAQHAKQGGFAIYSSVMFQEKWVYVNRGFFMRPDGSYDYYDKRHSFTLAKEHQVYTSGKNPVIATHLGWKFNLQICYDLRFPVFSRNTQDYDVLLYVANWPVPRIAAWDALLKARAIENMAYAIGVNRVGTDGTGMEYTGHSQVYDVLGEPLLDHPWTTAGTQQVELNKDQITRWRRKLKFLDDRDSFTLE